MTMSDMIGPGPQSGGLVERVKAILLKPTEAWPRIAVDPSSIGDIYRSWVIPLAAIGPVAAMIGSLVFGHGAFGITYRPTIMGALVTAIVSYLLVLGGVYVVGLVINALAPQFGAVQNKTAAFKVAAFSATAAWVAGVFGLLPAIGFLSILGLYSIYLLYTGLPVLMKAPADKATSYTIVVIVVMLVVGLVLGALTAPLAGLLIRSPMASGTVSGSLNVPGAGSVDLGKLEDVGKRLEDSAKAMQNGESKPAIAPDVLQTLLPDSLPGGLARTSIESASAGAAGIGGSNAEARYGVGENEIRLTVTDLGAMGGLAALGSAFNVQSSKQTATSYEKVGKVDGRMTTEKYDNTDKRGEYGTLVADRIMVQAEGNAPSIDAFKAAVAAIDLAKVEALAKQ
jgi:Yip1 domain